tara:strand:+ start:422 stop:1567 length:1146 start_codon:yes stop_codon:yes gene_type:complete
MSLKNDDYFFISSISEVSKTNWNKCSGLDHPFTRYEFLHALEKSNSVSIKTGWQPHHYIEKNKKNDIIAICPLYIKNHSFGEYIFDHAWADAYHRNGLNYYPKLQSAIPFTPVTGNRLLISKKIKNKKNKTNSIIKNILEEVKRLKVSSLHFNFVPKTYCNLNLMTRQGIQYHWKNENYNSFDDFLQNLSSRKRKAIKKERKSIADSNLSIKLFSGDEIKIEHINFFYDCYLNTTEKKWGSTYLTKNFFIELLENFSDKILFIIAFNNYEMVAAAINFISSTHLYGRLWGSKYNIPFLHFELCYYQAIEYAINKKLKVVEAGAQGEHKIQRGYVPEKTWSIHWIKNKQFSEAIEKFLDQETKQLNIHKENLEQFIPYKSLY